MKKLLLVLVLFALASPAYATVHPAADCTQSAVASAVAAATEDGAIVTVPAATCAYPGTTWTSATPVVWDVPPNGIFRCLSSWVASDKGNDGTVTISDGVDRNTVDTSGLLHFSVSDTGVFQLEGCTFTGSGVSDANDYTYQGLVRIYGGPNSEIRVHHNQCYLVRINCISFNGHPYGVVDHNRSDQDTNGWPYRLNGYNQDGVWAEDTAFGTANFLFFEDNLVNSPSTGAPMNDAYDGPHAVFRYNTMSCSSIQNHGPTAASRHRGTRAMEIYGNNASDASACSGAVAYALGFFTSGSVLMWGNNIGASVFNYKATMVADRKNDDAYPGFGLRPPAAFSYCGPAPQTRTVDTSGTAVTWASGTQFNTGWPGQTMMNIAGTDYEISSVSSATVLTLQARAGSQTGATYAMGSNIDENAVTTSGRRCLDQPGNGKGDLLGGDFGVGAGVVNVTQSNANYSTANWWPRQALEPIYEWLNTGTNAQGCCTNWLIGGGVGAGNFAENYNYYLYNSTGTTSGTNQTTGVRSGTIANRPGTCTAGVAYWATDEGEWNSTNGATADGKMYMCTATNTWTARYGFTNDGNNTNGTPYIYPHPLIALTDGGGSPPVEEPAIAGASRMRLR